MLDCGHARSYSEDGGCRICRRRRDSFHRMDRRYSNGFRSVAILALAVTAGLTTLALLLAFWDTGPAVDESRALSDAATTPPPP